MTRFVLFYAQYFAYKIILALNNERILIAWHIFVLNVNTLILSVFSVKCTWSEFILRNMASDLHRRACVEIDIRPSRQCDVC